MKPVHSSRKTGVPSRRKPKSVTGSKGYPKNKPDRKEESFSDEKDTSRRKERPGGKPATDTKRVYKSTSAPRSGRSFDRSEDQNSRPKFDKPDRDEKRSSRPKFDRSDREERQNSRPKFGKPDREERQNSRPKFGKPDRDENQSSRPKFGKSDRNEDQRSRPKFGKPDREEKRSSRPKTGNPDKDLIRLNKYLANAGVCSRREADELIRAGAVSVNGAIVTELGTKVSPTDKVQYGDQTLKREKPQYLLLNKPKGYITTLDDPQDRKTVFSLIQDACKERIYPVGRLDRNSTGLLLFTNDGDLAKKLTHPSYGVTKLYHVELDKQLTKNDFTKIMEGIELEDGFVKFDTMEYTSEGSSKKELGVQIHSGRNRIVRRVFESLGYTVVKLDRVLFAGLTKKNLPRGKWRFLAQEEINHLKMFKG
jgi:23S rRNA pseudouridine2605 synthase